jgi:hypothetical protein
LIYDLRYLFDDASSVKCLSEFVNEYFAGVFRAMADGRLKSMSVPVTYSDRNVILPGTVLRAKQPTVKPVK